MPEKRHINFTHDPLSSYFDECQKNEIHLLYLHFFRNIVGRGSSVGCASAWYADGRRFDPQVRQHSFVDIDHEIISMAILSLPLIQEGQLSVSGERMCTKYW